MEEPEWCRNSKLVQDALQFSSTTSFDALGNYKLKFTDDATKEKRILVKMIKSNLYKFYKLYWHWSSKNKMDELMLDVMRYIIVYENEEIVGFASYTFIHEHLPLKSNVLYLFEIQVDREHRGHGIGQTLMDHIERIALASEMEEIRLTCFKENPSFKWYKRMNYHLFLEYQDDAHLLELRKIIQF